MSFKRILVAIERSPSNVGVFEQAIDLARKESASLMIFHCLSEGGGVAAAVPPVIPEVGLDPIGVGLDPAGIGTLQPFQQQFQQESVQQEVEQVQDWLRTHQQQAANLGISAEFDYRMGDAGREICELAQRWSADLVVLGRRGLKGITEFLEGSVSNYVVHHAPCSVLVIQDASK